MIEPVIVIADWDADGVVSAAMILYSQSYLGIYPLKGKKGVELRPATPRTLSEALELKPEYMCPECVVFLDIPFTKYNYSVLRNFREKCKDVKMVYVDHHLSTIYHSQMLEKIIDEVIVGRSATVILIYQLLKSLGVKLTIRLDNFARAVNYMERGIKAPPELSNMVKLASAISKALKAEHNPTLWERLIKWMASPLPFTTPPPLDKAIEKARQLAIEADKAIKDIAMDLAMSAQRVGYLRFVDARKISNVSATALASKIRHILRQPVALLARRENFDVLVIKATRGLVAKIADVVYSSGIAEDIGGHASLAVLKLRKNIDINTLIEILRRASLRI